MNKTDPVTIDRMPVDVHKQYAQRTAQPQNLTPHLPDQLAVSTLAPAQATPFTERFQPNTWAHFEPPPTGSHTLLTQGVLVRGLDVEGLPENVPQALKKFSETVENLNTLCERIEGRRYEFNRG